LRSALRSLVGDLLLRLLREYSPTFREEGAIRALKEFVEERLGFDVVRIDSTGNLVASYGEGDVSIAFVGHIDTVPGELPVRFSGGFIEGRGAVDAKGPLAAAFVGASAARTSAVDGVARVYAVAVVGEEGPSHGAWGLIKDGFMVDHLVICEPSNATGVVVEYRGSLGIEVSCRSPGGHSSNPRAARSACDKLIDLWLKLESLNSSKGVSVALTKLVCGSDAPVLPREGVARLDVRVPYGSGKEVVENFVKASLPEGCTYSVRSYVEPVKVPINSTVVRAVIRSLIRQGVRPRVVRKLGTSDMNILYGRASREAVSYGPGNPELSHTDREVVSLKDLELSARVYAGVVKEVLQLRGPRV